MNRSTPGLPVHHQLPEFTQTHVHPVDDPSSHLIVSSPSPPAPNPSQNQSFPMSQHFAWGGQSIGVSASASVFPMNTQDWFPLGWTGWISLQSKGLSRNDKSVFSLQVNWHLFDPNSLTNWTDSPELDCCNHIKPNWHKTEWNTIFQELTLWPF